MHFFFQDSICFYSTCVVFMPTLHQHKATMSGTDSVFPSGPALCEAHHNIRSTKLVAVIYLAAPLCPVDKLSAKESVQWTPSQMTQWLRQG